MEGHNTTPEMPESHACDPMAIFAAICYRAPEKAEEAVHLFSQTEMVKSNNPAALDILAVYCDAAEHGYNVRN